MRLVDLTLATPEENLALDEALLDEAEHARGPLEFLRLWESPAPLVVVGRSSQAAREVQLDFCRRNTIPVLRRTSGGAAIVAGPGSLMHALVLSYEARPELRTIDAAHRHVLGTMVDALRPLVPQAAHRGTCDLAVGDRKFGGNSMRCKRRSLVYHGTLLYNFDLALVGQCLHMPPRQPDYRAGRGHEAFIANVPVDRQQLRAALIAAWHADTPATEIPRERVAQLVAERYSRSEWNLQR